MTAIELSRLMELVQKIKQKGRLSAKEAVEYKKLSEKAQGEENE